MKSVGGARDSSAVMLKKLRSLKATSKRLISFSRTKDQLILVASVAFTRELAVVDWIIAMLVFVTSAGTAKQGVLF